MKFTEAFNRLEELEAKKRAFEKPVMVRQAPHDFVGFRIENNDLCEFDIDEPEWSSLAELNSEFVMAKDWEVRWILTN
jgi:hypothetical protein